MKFSKQTIFTLLGILVIAGSIPLAVILVKQRQEIRKEAASCYTSGTSCASKGGKCGAPSACPPSQIKTGLCPGGTDCVCCIPPTKVTPTPTKAPPPTPTPAPGCYTSGTACANAGGKCGAPSACPPSQIKTGLCPGGTDCVCCIPPTKVTPTPTKAPPPPTSTPTASCYTSSTCQAAGGTCGDPNKCSGTLKTGICPGGSDCVCCIPSTKVTPTPSSGDYQQAWGHPVWGRWNTGRSCAAPPPTPTPTGTPTPTPTGTVIPTPTGTPTPTPTGTPTTTPTPTGTVTPTPTPTIPVSCDQTCNSDGNCTSGLICYNSRCRNSNCPSETDCSCPGPTATPTPTATSTPGPTATPTTVAQATPTPVVELPKAGFALPTFGAIIGGILLIVTSLIFIL